MADSKITELNSITGSQVSGTSDVLAIVDDSASETKKITADELFRDRTFVGGTIDNAVIGGSTPEEGYFTNLNADDLNGIEIGAGGGNIGTNTALGLDALENNTTGTNVTAVGRYSLQENTIGTNNTAVGRRSLISNTTGDNNTAVGTASIENNTTGTNNTAVGRQSLLNNTEGNNNTVVGRSAGDNITTGSNNTCVGFDADPIVATDDNQISIFAGTTKWYSASGDPEGSVTAGVGSLYTRTDGGTGSTLYVKESGTGNTGWVAK